jgi:hypothetical protein
MHPVNKNTEEVRSNSGVIVEKKEKLCPFVQSVPYPFIVSTREPAVLHQGEEVHLRMCCADGVCGTVGRSVVHDHNLERRVVYTCERIQTLQRHLASIPVDQDNKDERISRWLK